MSSPARSSGFNRVNRRIPSLLHRESVAEVARLRESRRSLNSGEFSGLALRDQRYDLITQQPLYLRQAGSGMLLSREYMQLVRSRLKPRGIFCCYCNAMQDDALAAIVRRTAAEVFAHCESFYGGYAIMASDSPIRFSRPAVEHRLSQGGRLAAEMSRHIEDVSLDRFLAGLDAPRLEWTSAHRVTDDHPIVEFYDVRSFWSKDRD